MEHLSEIVKIITRKKLRKLDVVDESMLNNNASMFKLFYDGILKDEFDTDESAAKILYDSQPSDDRYRQLKSRFRKRLLNTLFLLDAVSNSKSTYDKVFYDANKDWALIKILLSNDAHQTAYSIARHLLHIALKYKFVDIIVNCARLLREQAAMECDEKAFEEYDTISKQYTDILNAEIRAEELYQRVAINYNKPYSKTLDLDQKIEAYSNAVNSLSREFASRNITYCKYFVDIYKEEISGNFDKMSNVCQSALSFAYKNLEFTKQESLFSLFQKTLIAALHLSDTALALETLEKIDTYYQGDFPSTGDLYSIVIMILMKCENFEESMNVFNRYTQKSEFKSLPKIDTYKWEMIQKLLHGIILIHPKYKNNFENLKSPKFSLAKYLKEEETMFANKKIFYSNLLIIKSLVCASLKRYSESDEIIEELKIIALKFFKKEEYDRLVHLIKLLVQLKKADYDMSNISLLQKYESVLFETPYKFRGLEIEYEFLPFDYLWRLTKEIFTKS